MYYNNTIVLCCWIINLQQLVTATWQTYGLVRWVMALMPLLVNPEIEYGNRLQLDNRCTHNITLRCFRTTAVTVEKQ